MTATPDFVFNEKTGELQRGDKLIALCRLHADMFACLAKAQGPISKRSMAVALNVKPTSLDYEWPAFRGRLCRLGIRVASQQGGRSGYWLVFDEVPKRRVIVPPPVEVPFQ